MATLNERLQMSLADMKDIKQQLKFAGSKHPTTRVFILEEYADKFARAIEAILEAKEKGL